jgi:hypothetical protein
MTQNSPYLSRKQAAAYLRSQGIAVSPGTLAQWGLKKRQGEGPPYKRFKNGLALYTREDLDEWRDKNLRPVG